MAERVRKLIVCIDTYREEGDTMPLRGVRILDDESLLPLGTAPCGAYHGEKDALIEAVNDLYSKGGTGRRPRKEQG